MLFELGVFNLGGVVQLVQWNYRLPIKRVNVNPRLMTDIKCMV